MRQLDRGCGWIVLGYIMQCEVITRGEEATLTWHDPLIMASAGGEGGSFNVVLVVRGMGGLFFVCSNCCKVVGVRPSVIIL